MMPKLWVIGALLALCLLAVVAAPGRAQDPGTRIGPRMPYKIGAIAPSPDWATDGVILAVRDQGSYKQDLMRTRDGGQSWQLLPLPRSDATRLSSWFVQGPGGRIVFYLAGVSSKGNLSLDDTLFRSADDGETWEDVAHERRPPDHAQLLADVHE